MPTRIEDSASEGSMGDVVGMMNGLKVDPNEDFIGAIDAGTSSVRFYIFNSSAQVICSHQLPFEQIYPSPGHHEHDPEVYLTTLDICMRSCMEQFAQLGYSRDQLKGVGIANQRETTIVWDRITGKPLYNALVWPDTRNAAIVRDLREKAKMYPFSTPGGVLAGEEGIQALTGLPLNTYFSATKYAWLLENVPAVRAAKEAGTLMLGTVESWLMWRYTGLHIMDVTNASRTLCLSLYTLEWDDDLLSFFDLPREALPRLVSNSEVYGRFGKGQVLEGVQIAGLMGDQQAALVGNRCLDRGQAKNTYGTGCFLLKCTGPDLIRSTQGLLTTVAYKAGPEGEVIYALEGSIAVGGSSVQWLKDSLGIISSSREVGELAGMVEDTAGVYFVPAFSGLFAPYWDPRAAGLIIGLTAATTRHHICRATLEATCFQTKAVYDAMRNDTLAYRHPLPGHDIDAYASANGTNGHTNGNGAAPAKTKNWLRVDGGMTESDITMQLQADILGISVERPNMREFTALGAAFLAGSALRLFGWNLADPSTLPADPEGVTVFQPSIAEEDRVLKYQGWERAVERAKGWKTDSGLG